MTDTHSTRGEGSLTQEAFDKLLLYLSSDRDKAGERYELLRLKLIEYFNARGCFSAEDRADETINRVARKITEGIEIQNLAAYSHGVARLVWKEWLRTPDNHQVPLEEVSITQLPTLNSPEDSLQQQCFDQCFEKLSDEDGGLLLEYQRHEDLALRDARKTMAQRLKITPAALRIRVHRIKARLETCVSKCVSSRIEKT